MIHLVVLCCAVILLVLILLCLYRVISGPSVLDRILGGNVIGTHATVILLLIGILYNNLAMFVDIALAYALLNFIATIGSTKYLLRSKRVFLDSRDDKN
ncbi:MAG TPA: monovalent cation/H+ antiporter complex subunit F [Deltaproteobacteria bacterium]|nr:monovalent cation/H+ antiporter complex subunit F [Deltaproteobacteria bacterium]HQB39122.1 monovalent cation/H+ antiporter complex subunit F [Deltaproteobacteria bacterium]